MDHIKLRVFITALYLTGVFVAVVGASSQNLWMAFAGLSVFGAGVSLRFWMLKRGWV